MNADKGRDRGGAGRGRPFNLVRTSLLCLAALTGFGAGAALAQPMLSGGQVQQVRLGGDVGGARYGVRYEDRRFSREAIRRFHDRVEWALSRGALTRGEADRLHFRADALEDLARAMSRRDGLDYYERQELDDRFDDLRAQFRRLVWQRDYRGPYREEWRNSRDDEERFWREDDRSDLAAGADYAARSDRAAPDLKGRDDDWQPPELGKGSSSPQVMIPPPQPYRSEQPFPPSTRKPSPGSSAKPAPAAQGDDQPFKDGRDFH